MSFFYIVYIQCRGGGGGSFKCYVTQRGMGSRVSVAEMYGWSTVISVTRGNLHTKNDNVALEWPPIYNMCSMLTMNDNILRHLSWRVFHRANHASSVESMLAMVTPESFDETLPKPAKSLAGRLNCE